MPRYLGNDQWEYSADERRAAEDRREQRGRERAQSDANRGFWRLIGGKFEYIMLGLLILVLIVAGVSHLREIIAKPANALTSQAK